jgi:hypothetical protein
MSSSFFGGLVFGAALPHRKRVGRRTFATHISSIALVMGLPRRGLFSLDFLPEHGADAC